MEVKALYRQFMAFAKAASDNLGEDAATNELSSVLAISAEEFQSFWARISRHEELRRTWVDRLTRGYAAVKGDLRAVFEADVKRNRHAISDQLDRKAA